MPLSPTHSSDPAAAPSAALSARASAPRKAWRRACASFGFGGYSTFFLTRWLVLRAIGAIFVIVFAGVIADQAALIGPHGIFPLADFLREWREKYPNPIEAFLRAPSLFWLGANSFAIAAVAWSGLGSAVALVLNLWPRLTLFGCWVCLLSFVTTWRGFTATQVDQLMLETALLCIPFAPAGLRPRLGATSPPAPAAVFLVRWLLFRVMIENGLVKLFAGDPHWLDFTALDVLYETSPFPTIIGYYDHQWPHAWHAFEVVLTYVAEIAAPLAVLLGGARTRWFAFIVWTGFQLGIQLTNNFGWLNTASIALGLLLLDDQMIVAALNRCRSTSPDLPARPSSASPRWLRFAAVAHFTLTLYFLAVICGSIAFHGSRPLLAAQPLLRLLPLDDVPFFCRN